MNITKWTLALVSLFNVQYSYDVSKEPIDSSYIAIHNGTLRTCIYPEDKPFRKGSDTYPRAELRSREEFEYRKGTYMFHVNFTNLPNATDFSVWQVFGGGKPLLMVRHRDGQKQLVVFDGCPKIQEVTELPSECTVDCKAGKVTCGVFYSYGKLKCRKVHLKLGVYSQQKNPEEKMCIDYNEVKAINV